MVELLIPTSFLFVGVILITILLMKVPILLTILCGVVPLMKETLKKFSKGVNVPDPQDNGVGLIIILSHHLFKTR